MYTEEMFRKIVKQRGIPYNQVLLDNFLKQNRKAMYDENDVMRYARCVNQEYIGRKDYGRPSTHDAWDQYYGHTTQIW